jgi:hypothetical protein
MINSYIEKLLTAINGLSEFFQEERKRVPGSILYEADRLECLFFLRYDPHFEGDEPLSLQIGQAQPGGR